MGGQQFGEAGILVDTRDLNRVLAFDAERGTITVEGGIQWPQLLELPESRAGGAGRAMGDLSEADRCRPPQRRRRVVVQCPRPRAEPEADRRSGRGLRSGRPRRRDSDVLAEPASRPVRAGHRRLRAVRPHHARAAQAPSAPQSAPRRRARARRTGSRIGSRGGFATAVSTATTSSRPIRAATASCGGASSHAISRCRPTRRSRSIRRASTPRTGPG